MYDRYTLGRDFAEDQHPKRQCYGCIADSDFAKQLKIVHQMHNEGVNRCATGRFRNLDVILLRASESRHAWITRTLKAASVINAVAPMPETVLPINMVVKNRVMSFCRTLKGPPSTSLSASSRTCLLGEKPDISASFQISG